MSSNQQDAGRSHVQPWARQPEATGPSTARLRRIVEGLPDWEPLPPGEILVRRGGNG
ncbi:hypothetical protein [Streptomyces sp. NPDC054961]